jgi:ATP-dependent helicase/nuclease subunit B
MLRLVMGRSGSGKSRFALDKAEEAMNDGRKAVVIVPEQFTFETERSLLRSAGPSSCLNIEVLSFSRMAHKVASGYGGFAGRYIDNCGRAILMHKAITEVTDRLKIYGRQAGYPSFAKTMVETASEYKLCSVTPEMLDEASVRTDDQLLRSKLKDVSLILRSYDALLADRFIDPSDDLSRLADLLRKHRCFEGEDIIIDSFKGFTAQEKEVIAELIKQAKDVYITLCAERGELDNAYGLFAPVGETKRSLIALAGRCGVPAASICWLDGTKRFEAEPLRELEKRIFRPEAKVYDFPAPEIHIISAANFYDESQFAAQEIARLIREEGARCRDFVVISRGLENYQGILDPVFEKYGIPLFFDKRRDIAVHPLMTALLCALEIISGNWRPDPVFRYLKTGLAGFDSVEISKMENYTLIWNIRGERWLSPWTDNPDGFTGSLTADGQKTLAELNALREKLTTPFIRLSAALDNAPDVSAMISALYSFLTETGADKAVQSAHDRLEEAGELELADEYRQIWEKLGDVFDQAAAVLGQEKMTVSGLGELLKLAIENMELAHIPPSLDEVTAGDAERIRAGSAKYAFVIGLADGIFPKAQTSSGVMTDAEREELIALGLELSPPARRKVAEERFIAYEAFTCASDRLYLSCPRSDAAGKSLRPSPFLLSVKTLFPHSDIRSEALENDFDSVQNERSAFDMLALRFGRRGTLRDSLESYFEKDKEYSERLAALKAAMRREPAVIKDKSVARELYGEKMNISPSRLESFEQCRFLYFCRYGLGAKARKKAELAAPEIGTLIHFVLERLLSAHQAKKLWETEKSELDCEIDALLAEFAKMYFGGLEDKPERFKYLYLRLRQTVIVLVERIAQELSVSDFYPVDFELDIRSGGDVAPELIELKDGGAIAVEGKVDRVDIMKKSGKTYLRVIDYKTGAKTFSLPDVEYGLNLQMFIYLFTLCSGAAKRYKSPELLPAGVLYLPAKRPDVSVDRGEDDDKIRKQTSSAMKMSGLVLRDAQVVDSMEHGAAGIFIPARLKISAGAGDDPFDASSSVATLEQFGILKTHIDKTLKKMASALRDGDVEARPVDGLGYHPCDYCEFSSVCGHESGDEVKYLHASKNVWDDLKGGDENG